MPAQTHSAPGALPPTNTATDRVLPPDAIDDQAESGGKPKNPDGRTSSLRKHSGVPDYETYHYGYPMTPGLMFGSGN